MRYYAHSYLYEIYNFSWKLIDFKTSGLVYLSIKNNVIFFIFLFLRLGVKETLLSIIEKKKFFTVLSILFLFNELLKYFLKILFYIIPFKHISVKMSFEDKEII